MQDDELRAIQLADPLRLKRLHLTPVQYTVLKLVISKAHEPVRSTDLKHHMGMTIKTASGVLLGLHNQAYLDRVEVPQKTGGIEYQYKVKPAILRAYYEVQRK